MRPDNNPQGPNLPPGTPGQNQSNNGPQPQTGQPRTLFSPPLQLPGSQFDQYGQSVPNLPPPQQTSPAIPSINAADPAQQPAAGPVHHTKRNVLITVIALTATMLLVLLSFYIFYYLPRKPETVVAKALVGTVQQLLQRQLQANVSGIVSYTNPGEQDLRLRSDITGSIDGQKGFSLSADSVLNQGEESVTFKSSLQTSDFNDYFVKFDQENTSSDEDAAAEGNPADLPVTSIKNTGTPYDLVSMILAQYDDTWLKITDEQLREIVALSREDQASDERIPLVRLAIIYQNNPFIIVNETVGVEDISGQESQHYKVTLSNSRLRAFLAQVKAQKLSLAGFGDKDIDTLLSRIKTNASSPVFDVWVNEQGYVNQLSFESGSSKTSNLRVRLTLSDIGTPQPVINPKSSKPLQPLLKDVLGVDAKDSVKPSTETPEGRDAERKADIKTIQTLVEEFYALNGNYPLRLNEVKDLPLAACKDPQASGTCTTPDYTYTAFRFSTPPSPATTADCNNSAEQCQGFVIFTNKMEAEKNPYSVTSE